MTTEELKKELIEAEKNYELQKRSIYRKFALANNPYKIGDIVTDHAGTIRIEKIEIYVSFGVSCCVYKGVQLNKDGNPSKRQDHTTVFQTNIPTNEAV